jgi:TolB protein
MPRSGQRRMAAQGLPIWSPDGRKIVFERGRDLYVMNTDGSGLRRLTRDTAYDERPVWSPDGRKIAFDRNNGNEPDVYVINVDGRGERNLTRDDTSLGPTWSPDGRKTPLAAAAGSPRTPTAAVSAGSRATRVTSPAAMALRAGHPTGAGSPSCAWAAWARNQRPATSTS